MALTLCGKRGQLLSIFYWILLVNHSPIEWNAKLEKIYWLGGQIKLDFGGFRICIPLEEPIRGKKDVTKFRKTELEAVTCGLSKAMDDTNVQDPWGQMRRCPKGQRFNVKTGSCDEIWASKPHYNQHFSAGSMTRRCSRGQTFDISLGECKWPQESRQQWKQKVWSGL